MFVAISAHLVKSAESKLWVLKNVSNDPQTKGERAIYLKAELNIVYKYNEVDEHEF